MTVKFYFVFGGGGSIINESHCPSNDRILESILGVQGEGC